MSTAELKLALIREIDKLPAGRLIWLLGFVRRNVPLEEPRKKRRLGALKGTLLYMSPDFDEPLDDFQDHM